jgi:hypothetical protein
VYIEQKGKTRKLLVAVDSELVTTVAEVIATYISISIWDLSRSGTQNILIP